jgi:rod shape determining protein RodA
MLIGVELFGSVAMGGQRWINLGLIKIQPSEPAKIAVVLMLAKYFHNVSHNDINKIHKLIIPIIAILIPCALIIKQPDLGTGMVVLIVSTIMLFALGVSIWKFITVGAAAIISLPIIWQMMYDYQKRRILMFWDPSQDPLGSGYNIIQSKIAIGSGGMLGKGLTQGTQSQLEFLPEHQTDFIFATMAEELGFIGGMVLVTLYAMVIILSLLIAINSKSLFGKLIAIGITSIFFSHIFINMGMVMGLLPVVGVPLPLISYGGTMMSSMLVGLGLIMNVEVNRNQAI